MTSPATPEVIAALCAASDECDRAARNLAARRAEVRAAKASRAVAAIRYADARDQLTEARRAFLISTGHPAADLDQPTADVLPFTGRSATR